MTVAILGGHKNFSSHGSFKLDRVDKFSLGKLDHLCQSKRNLGDLSGRKRTFSKSSQKYGLCLLSKPYVLPFPSPQYKNKRNLPATFSNVAANVVP